MVGGLHLCPVSFTPTRADMPFPSGTSSTEAQGRQPFRGPGRGPPGAQLGPGMGWAGPFQGGEPRRRCSREGAAAHQAGAEEEAADMETRETVERPLDVGGPGSRLDRGGGGALWGAEALRP